MNTEHLLEDIREVNLSYLLLMQRLISSDREMAMFRLKIDEETADLLENIPIPELARLARCNQLLCHFSVNDADQLHALINSAKDDRMRQIHAAIVLGGHEHRREDRREDDRRSGKDRRVENLGPPGGKERRKDERRTGDRRTQPRRFTDRGKSSSQDGSQDDGQNSGGASGA